MERSFKAYGVGLNNNIFEGTLHGDDKKPIQNWMFEIDMEAHPYLKHRKDFLALKDIWVNLGQIEKQ